ncbi:MAG: hypothetical protein HY089_13315 [Ignavibacteriales bacterium]|nr:hypothetical protein [Ignavibacteriales bacterium]
MTRTDQIDEELSVFKTFKKHYPSDLTGVEQPKEPEPDIRCKSSDGTVLAFELVELIDREYIHKNSAASAIDDEFRKYFKKLPKNSCQRLQSILKDAFVFVEYTEEATDVNKRSVIPEVFKFLQSKDTTDSGDFPTNGVKSLKHFVKKIHIGRGNFNGPSWGGITAGLRNDTPIKKIPEKFKKRYSTDAQRIELLAYFKYQPLPLPDFIPKIEEDIRKDIASSQFSAVWIYSAVSDKVLLHIVK